ncbi:Obg-like ATPase 1 [Plasmodiophora brassicae]|uniref:Obg-like ATPase 1 n=1 Tax=Plasmodiophora brassicae TaxID=37360 RepID=A0A0G4IH32_PLABS|nr:hypothetical protein PBRA_000172 [Plasmodiophora brassicae]SPQ96735.1 unnamed protein product [Plasmodiophora brassicae]
MPPKAKAAETSNIGPRFGRVKSNLKMGLVGLPNVGKSSLFNLLTEQSVPAENFPFCTIDPSQARCAIPDERYDWLRKVWGAPSNVPAYLLVTDIAGLIRGASEGAGLGNAFLSHIQAVDGIFHLIRVFDNPEVTHVDECVDPIRDLDTILQELCKKDLAYVQAQRAMKERDVKRTPNAKLPPIFFSVMDKVEKLLEDTKGLAGAEWTPVEVEKINELIPQAITLKPVVYLINMSKKDYVRKKNKWLLKIKQWIDAHHPGIMIPVSVDFEQELWSLRDDASAREAFMAAAGGNVESALPKIIKAGHKELKLMYFFTAGETEVRCWTISQGTLAPQAAGAIHSDMEKGFIKAEVASFDDFKELSGGTRGGMAKVKAAGKYRQEGKSYVVQDGDIIYFQFNTPNPSKKK